MTNAIGSGTVNICVNVPIDERQELGRLATAESRSLGSLVRDYTLKGLRSELTEVESQLYRSVGFVSRDGEIKLFQRAEVLRQTLQRITEVRRQYYAVTMLALFVALLACGHANDLRRARGRRVEEVREDA